MPNIEIDSNRHYRIALRRRELQWSAFKRNLNRRYKTRLIIGLPAMAVFVVFIVGNVVKMLPVAWQPVAIGIGLLALVVWLGLSFWPFPHTPEGYEFDAEATNQIDLEIARERGSGLQLVE